VTVQVVNKNNLLQSKLYPFIGQGQADINEYLDNTTISKAERENLGIALLDAENYVAQAGHDDVAHVDAQDDANTIFLN